MAWVEGKFEVDFVHSVFGFLFYKAVKLETMSQIVDVLTITCWMSWIQGSAGCWVINSS